MALLRAPEENSPGVMIPEGQISSFAGNLVKRKGKSYLIIFAFLDENDQGKLLASISRPNMTSLGPDLV